MGSAGLADGGREYGFVMVLLDEEWLDGDGAEAPRVRRFSNALLGELLRERLGIRTTSWKRVGDREGVEGGSTGTPIVM